MATETSPLIGDIPRSSPSKLHPRIHFLDNIRAGLTAQLIFQHSIMAVAQTSIHHPVLPLWESVPLSLYLAVQGTFLWALFFFVAGYSTHLALREKGDYKFFISRTVKVGLPALLWAVFGRFLLYKIFAVLGLGEIFDEADTRLVGPVAFVIGLLALDYTYLALRWIGTRYPSLSQCSSQILEGIVSSKGRFYFVFSLTFDIIVIFTFFSSVGVPFYPSNFYSKFIYDIRDYPTSPASFVIAYIAGVSFPSIGKYLRFSSERISVVAALGADILTYLTLFFGQHFIPLLWESIKVRDRTDGRIHFVSAGFNLHTIFFAFWNTFVFYALSLTIVGVCVRSPLGNKDRGAWTRHTYTQIYVHMVPVTLAIHFLPSTGILGDIIVKSFVVCIIGASSSWAIAFTPAGLRWAFNRVQSTLRG